MSLRSFVRLILFGLLVSSGFIGTAQADRWQPRLFKIEPEEEGKDPFFFDFHPDYRVRYIRIDPLELNGTTAQDVAWAEQRLRLDASVGLRGIGAIHMQFDVLDGALFGDNGRFGGNPSSTTGVGIASKRPNESTMGVGLIREGGGNSVDDYGLVLKGLTPIQINYIYGEVLLPFGLLRVGRQPTVDNGTIAINDGRADRNRWGVSQYHSASDRIAFGTKISELFGIIANGKEHQIDKSLDNGVILGLAYDMLVEDEPSVADDDLEAFSLMLDFRSKDPSAILGDDAGPIRFTSAFSYRWDQRYGTQIFAMPLLLEMNYWKLHFRGEFSYIFGQTREISAGFAELANSPVVMQDISMMMGRAIVDLKLDDLTLTMLYGYASGDEDPRATTVTSQATWARDTNLGLLMFEHTLAYQSARTAAVGVENLKAKNAASFPITETATDGRATNMHALFPQIFYNPIDDLTIKAGALFAWTAVPAIDPIMTTLAIDGDSIKDDQVNFNGGKPGNYWGTEIDLGVEYRYKEFFQAVVEAAILFPGNAFYDENGEAANSWMIETRFRFRL